MKKRIIIITSVLVALLMAVTVFPVVATDATGTYTLALDTSKLESDREFTVTVSVNDGDSMSGFQFVLPYDNSRVGVKTDSIDVKTAVLDASVGGDDASVLYHDTGSEVRFISVSENETYASSGITELFSVTFSVKEGQTVEKADITAETSPVLNLNPNSETRTFKTLAAKVTGTAGAVTVDPVTMVTQLKRSELTLKTTSIATIDTTNKYLNGIAEKTSMSDLKTQFENTAADIKLFKTDGTEITANDAYIGTGSQIKLYENNEVVDTLTLVVKGDVNGDGQININDLLILRQILARNVVSTALQEKAIDIVIDNNININDLLLLRQHLARNININS